LIGTWAALPTSNTLEDVNPDNDPNVNPNYPNAAPWRMNGGSHRAIIEAWCGAVFAPDLGRLMLVNAGGHGDGIPAASYDLQLNRDVPRYTRMCTPSGALGRQPLDYAAEFARGTLQLDMTGRHRAQHTQSFQVYWPNVGIATLSGIALASSGGSPTNPRPYVSNLNAGELIGGLGAPLTVNQAGNGSFAAACYDPKRNVAWHKGAGYESEFVKWGGPNNDSWTAPAGAPSYVMWGGHSLAYCPPLDLILVGNGDNSGTGVGPLNQTIDGGFGVFDPATGVLYAKGVTSTFPTFTGAPPRFAPWSTGLCPGLCLPQWSSRLGAFLAWDNDAGQTTKVMRIAPPASGDPRTGTWTVDYLPVSAANAVTPSAAHFNGTYGRFFVWDEAGICGAVNNVNEAGFFFRYA
jgi:hypothetical protein